MQQNNNNNLPGRSKAMRDQDLRDIRQAHKLRPHSGPVPPITGDTIITFGKHSGTKISQVPRHYLEYIAFRCRQDGRSLYTDNIYDRIRQYVESTH